MGFRSLETITHPLNKIINKWLRLNFNAVRVANKKNPTFGEMQYSHDRGGNRFTVIMNSVKIYIRLGLIFLCSRSIYF